MPESRPDYYGQPVSQPPPQYDMPRPSFSGQSQYAYGGHSASSSGHLQVQSGSHTHVPRRQQVCHFFNKPGGCRSGNNCAFLHVAADQLPAQRHQSWRGGRSGR